MCRFIMVIHSLMNKCRSMSVRSFAKQYMFIPGDSGSRGVQHCKQNRCQGRQRQLSGVIVAQEEHKT